MPYSNYSPKQKKLAALGDDKKKIDKTDIMILRKKPKKKKEVCLA